MNMLSLRGFLAFSLMTGSKRLNSPRLALLIYSCILTCALILGASYLFPHNQPFVIIEAVSEVLTYRVRRPEIAAILLHDAHLRGDFADCPTLSDNGSDLTATGILQPSNNSIVKYRFTPDRIAIEVDAGNRSAGELTLADGESCHLPVRVVATIDIRDKRLRPLPIAGPAEIGCAFGALSTDSALNRKSSDFMFGGTVRVFGHASFASSQGDLYSPPGGEFALPAGGRLTSEDDFNPMSQQSAAAPWYGIADLCDKGFRISATTVASDLCMYRPGASQDKEKFAFGVLTRIFFDPSMALLTFIFGSLTIIIQTVALFIDFGKKEQPLENGRRKRPKNTPTRPIIRPKSKYIRKNPFISRKKTFSLKKSTGR